MKKRMLCLTLATVMGCSVIAHGEAAKKKENTPAPKEKAPITIEADELYVNDKLGDFFAQGNVRINQKQEFLTTTTPVYGNLKRTEVKVDGSATLTDPGMNLTATGIVYNYTTKIGSIQQVKGKAGKQFVQGERVELEPNHIQLYNGQMTRCPAHKPDYHISADRVEVWPGDKMIAYNAKFWIKDTLIYTMAKYKRSLRAGEDGEDFPTVGYNNSDGAYIKQKFNYPVTDNISIIAEANYYSKRGFKPIFGVMDREKNYKISVVQGESTDKDNNWIKKEPEFTLETDAIRLGDLPISYTFTAIYGKWTDDFKSSWHQDYTLYFTRDPWALAPDLTLTLGAGYQMVRESYNSSSTNRLKFDVGLYKNWTPSLTTWGVYHYARDNNSLFTFNTNNLTRSVDLGIRYKIDNKNTLILAQTYDLVGHKIYDMDYIWVRDLHCWQLEIKYREKRNQWVFNVFTTRW